MRQFVLASTLSLTSCFAAAQACPSRTTINVESAGYSGAFIVELRSGTRPGSKVVGERSLGGPGSVTFTDVCPGTYFFTLGTPDSDSVSTTRYFNVVNDEYSYSNPTIRVFYSRTKSNGSQSIGHAKKKDL